ncbi:MAG: DNA-binding protein, partial [Steroidobacteraceae bacterium]
MAYTLAKAATAVGRDRSSILRAIKSGKLSAMRDEASGAWLIEPSELHRLYPPADAQGSAQPDAEVRTDESAPEIRELRALLEQERQERRRERADRDTVIADKDA